MFLWQQLQWWWMSILKYIQATGGKETGSGTFATRAQSAGDKNANTSSTGQGGQGGQKGSGGAGSGPGGK